MKNISYVINGILAVAIIILFVLFFTSKNSAEDAAPLKFEGGDTTAVLPIAYINVDSLLTKYQFAIDSSERLMAKFKSSNNTVTQKQLQLESAIADYQKKAQQNAFLNQERAQQEAQRIQNMETELQQMSQRLQQELAQEEMKINMQIADSVRAILGEFNKTANYEFILSNKGMDNILIAKEDKYNITNVVSDILNKRYKPNSTKK